MQAVFPELLSIIKELQALPCLKDFALAGGTNLALRYNHRKSEDIDLFSTNIVGIQGFERIEREVRAKYGNDVLNIVYPVKETDQFVDIRFWIKINDETIKVDVIQNMKALYPFETINNVRLYGLIDIGLFKMVSCACRPAKKDIYDLDHITDSQDLESLFELLKKKKEMFNKDIDRSIFDLDNDPDPIDNPLLLLNFDKRFQSVAHKIRHSHDNILIVEGAKTWRMASIHWRMKVRSLFRYLDIEYPK